MRKLFILLILLLFLVMPAAAQSTLPRYDQRAGFLLAAPSAFDDGLLGFVNPATLGTLTLPELRLGFGTDAGDWNANRHWGLLTGARNAGFGWIRQGETDEYRFSLAGGDEGFSLGVGYGWTKGAPVNHTLVTIGSLIRPSRMVSIGLSGLFS
ncbi:MAG TPA: hypothetical protein PLG50_10070, partial [bacterium]|nr:hypothetical protein [bacterium]